VDEERAKLKKKLLDFSKKRIKIAKEYTVSFTSAKAVHHDENLIMHSTAIDPCCHS
jgi:hypothetical protein